MTIAEKLKQIAENEQKVFDAGKQAEYDAFWDAIQNKGDYSCSSLGNVDIPRAEHLFGLGWTNETFKPKYDVVVLNNNAFVYTSIEDLRPETVGKNIDFSQLRNFNQFLRQAKTKYIGVVDMTSATNGSYMFAMAQDIEYVEKVILSPEYKSLLTFKTNAFWECTKLKEITFERYLYEYTSFQNCKLLSHASLISILNALYDYASDETDYSGRDKRLVLGSANLAKLTEEEQMIAFEKGWSLE